MLVVSMSCVSRPGSLNHTMLIIWDDFKRVALIKEKMIVELQFHLIVYAWLESSISTLCIVIWKIEDCKRYFSTRKLKNILELFINGLNHRSFTLLFLVPWQNKPYMFFMFVLESYFIYVATINAIKFFSTEYI